MALPLPVIPQQPDAFHLAPHRIKRCTFRRLIQVEAGGDRVYDVECLFPDRKVPIPLGDLESATPICNACVAPHIFRPTRTDRPMAPHRRGDLVGRALRALRGRRCASGRWTSRRAAGRMACR